ncbi:DUF1415 domain-containing protein [Vibrio sp.]|nr:DUF1415 domain-containing protein [Vibrio sp.]
MSNTQIEQQVEKWLDDVVIGLNLCPFAAKPRRNGQIKIRISNAKNDEQLLNDIIEEFTLLDNLTATDLETTLVVTPNYCESFDDYLEIVDWLEAIIDQQWRGTYQLATFHPDYYFDGTDPDDDENLTNRSPFPVFHLIREASMEKVLKHYPNPEAIPDTNIETVSNLTESQRQELFGYLFK